jgi:hypothetical protein
MIKAPPTIQEQPTFPSLIFILLWVAGIVLAKGWWVLLSILFPPYALYLVVEKVLQVISWV